MRFQKNLKIELFWLLTFLSVSACAIGEIVPVYTTVVYHFQAETAWDKLEVTVEDYHDHYQIQCKSDVDASSWVLAKGENNDTVASSDKNPGDSFVVNVNAPFTKCELTVMINNGTQEIPVVVSLSPDDESIWITPTPGPTPLNTRVSDLLYLAQKLEAAQNRLQALKLYLVVLKIEPHNKTAQAGLIRIQNAVFEILVKKLEHSLGDHDAVASQSVLDQIKKLNPADKRIAGWQSQIDAFTQPNAPKQ